MELTYLLAIEMQLILYCYMGNKLTHSVSNFFKIITQVLYKFIYQAEGIRTSLYKSGWVDADLKFKKDILITMMRMQRPIFLTIGKFSPLTLATFVFVSNYVLVFRKFFLYNLRLNFLYFFLYKGSPRSFRPVI